MNVDIYGGGATCRGWPASTAPVGSLSNVVSRADSDLTAGSALWSFRTYMILYIDHDTIYKS